MSQKFNIAADAAIRKKYEKMFASESPEELKKSVVVMGNVDCFGDAVPVQCAECGHDGSVRPWLARIAYKHGMTILCGPCAAKKYPEKFSKTMLEGLEEIMKVREEVEG